MTVANVKAVQVQTNRVEVVDADMTFYMQIYSDHRYAFHTLTQVRSLYRDARILLRSDGGGAGCEPWATIQAEMYDESRLFPIRHGGKVVQRMLEIYSEVPTPYLIKIDPDTVFHRRFRYLPSAEGLFGSVQGSLASRSIQGGCLGITRAAALAIAESRLLLDPMLSNPTSEQGPYMEILERRAKRCGLSSFDCLLGWAATKLGIRVFSFSEVRSSWEISPTNEDLRFAVTHPDPNRERWSDRSKDSDLGLEAP